MGFVVDAPDPPRSLSNSITLSLQGSEPFHNGTPIPIETILRHFFLFFKSKSFFPFKIKRKVMILFLLQSIL